MPTTSAIGWMRRNQMKCIELILTMSLKLIISMNLYLICKNNYRNDEKKYVLILLLCIHFCMLFSQLVYWMLDINYGDLYYIGESLFSRTKIGYDAVESLYNQIMFGMYYSILSSIILILLIRKYYKKWCLLWIETCFLQAWCYAVV